MKISAVTYQTNPYFAGNDKKPNKLKTAAGAAAIALATAAPMAESEAQIIPYTPTFIYETYTTTPNAINTPKCFVVGDITVNPDKNKTLRETFDEIDTNGNGVLSAKEVVNTERANWNEENLTPYTNAQARHTQKRFNDLAEVYNQNKSNPNTINYNEYKAIMKDYNESNDFVPLYTYPYIYTLPPLYYRPYYYHRPHIHHVPPPPPPHHHHHHHHR